MANRFLYISMFVVLILLMANQLLGTGLIHELLGVLLLVLTTIHMVRNLRWWSHIATQVKVAPLKSLTTIGLTLSIILAIVSGLIISRHLIFFESLLFLMPAMRVIHHYSVYWVLIFAALHIGIHGYILMHRFNIYHHLHALPTFVKAFIVLAIIGYGCYAFWYESIYMYLFFQMPYTYFDFNQPLYEFFLNYVSISGLFAVISYILEIRLKNKLTIDCKT